MQSLKENVKTVSPIPEYFVENYPEKETVVRSSSSWVRTKEIEQSAVEFLIHMNDGENSEARDEIGTEEPVKNSMFWLYRNFPHIV